MLAGMPVLNLLDRDVYLYSEVDRIVGLRPGTARRWINGYSRAGKHHDPILRIEPRDTEWATWGEFVEARILKEYREEIHTRRLREAVSALRQEYRRDYPLAYLQPYLSVVDKDLTIRANDAEAQVVVRTGQSLLGEGWPVIQQSQLAEDDKGMKFVAELPPDIDFPDIVVNPNRYSGLPTFRGRRVSVATIAGMVAAGEAPSDLAADYGLSLAQVENAVAFVAKHGAAA
ncbi:DUF433 domain-containing protein [Mycobacterium sp. SMC-4]|uniref:DUF433 domain-containing protein n=1 Tax=Mycobacterium sp. SMC-4 TaxID=2857059 RepID=UPI0021B33BDE|nr:DUF433 domain-containing protein [Mycobacterium sp. SMC-4]UXA16741.1 DUF433 domain-containing protein [Mycobacterium sp. SMC-4]